MELEVTLDPEALKNDLTEDKPSNEFEDQTLEANDTLITDKEPAICHFLFLEPMSEKKKSQLINKCQL